MTPPALFALIFGHVVNCDKYFQEKYETRQHGLIPVFVHSRLHAWSVLQQEAAPVHALS